MYRYGVGVIATRRIPKGIDPFKLASGKACADSESRTFCYNSTELRSMPPSTRKIMMDFIVDPWADGTTELCVPSLGPASFGVGWFANHEDVNPNVEPYVGALLFL